MTRGRFTSGRRVLLAACGVVLASCASRAPTGAKPGDPLGALRAAAEREQRWPKDSRARRETAAPVPDGVDALLGKVVGPDDARANKSLLEVVSLLAGPESAEPDHEASIEAVRLYVSGRTKFLEGNAAEAVRDLKAATELDPSAQEPWFALGEAQLAQGLRSDAVRSFRSSVASGGGDARALEFLGRAALERGDFEEAGAFLARALRARPERADPALPSVVGVEVARALAPLGYTRAAMESLLSVVSNPVQLTSSSRYAAELGGVFRRQGDLWREVGDAQCRLGLFEEAVESYRRSAELPSLEATPIRPRLVFALVRAGRPSQAGLDLMEDFVSRQGRVDDSDLALLRYITSHGGDPLAIVSALTEMQRAQTSPSLARSLSLARAGVLSDTLRAGALRVHITEFPTDIGAAVELLNTSPDAGAAMKEAVSLVGKRPADAKLLAEGLLRSRHGEKLLAPATGSAGAARLLNAYVAAKQGRIADALALVAGVTGGDRGGVRGGEDLMNAGAAAQVEIALDAGDVESAMSAVSRLERSGGGALSLRLLARSYLLMQQVRRASEASERLLGVTKPEARERIDDLLLAADIAARLGDASEAERRLNEAAGLDAYDERAPSLLLVLHSADGGMPDAGKMSRAARNLRQNMPGSRTLRLVRARELMRRQAWGAAEAELRTLVDDDPGDAGPMELLGLIWSERRGDSSAMPDAREWLAPHLRRRPFSPLLLAAVTTLDSVAGRSADAEKNLREALSAGAGPDVSRILERLIRQTPSRASEADALARRRLADRRRTVVESLEFAELSLSWNEPENAVAILRGGLGPDIELSGEQARRALFVAGRSIGALRTAEGVDKAVGEAAAVIDLCLPSIPNASSEMHQLCVESLAAIRGVSFDRLFSAIKLWLERYPKAGNLPYFAAVRGLVQARQSERVPEFVARAAELGLNDPTVLAIWFESVIGSGSAVSARNMLDTLHANNTLGGVLKRLSPNADIEGAGDLRAEAAYMIGVLFAQLKHENDAALMYEYALVHDPRHAWACNNLGYWLADRGEQIERASVLLETAYNAEPDATPIIDSLGWLRYKQGIILDVPDAATREVARRGALALLEEAAATIQGRTDNTIQDHVGDAQWLAGKRAEAISSWSRAKLLSEQTLSLVRQQGGREADDPVPDSAELAECRAIIESTSKKLEAAAAGGRVRVAPQYKDADPQPVAPDAHP